MTQTIHEILNSVYNEKEMEKELKKRQAARQHADALAKVLEEGKSIFQNSCVYSFFPEDTKWVYSNHGYDSVLVKNPDTSLTFMVGSPGPGSKNKYVYGTNMHVPHTRDIHISGVYALKHHIHRHVSSTS